MNTMSFRCYDKLTLSSFTVIELKKILRAWGLTGQRKNKANLIELIHTHPKNKHQKNYVSVHKRFLNQHVLGTPPKKKKKPSNVHQITQQFNSKTNKNHKCTKRQCGKVFKTKQSLAVHIGHHKRRARSQKEEMDATDDESDCMDSSDTSSSDDKDIDLRPFLESLEKQRNDNLTKKKKPTDFGKNHALFILHQRWKH